MLAGKNVNRKSSISISKKAEMLHEQHPNYKKDFYYQCRYMNLGIMYESFLWKVDPKKKNRFVVFCRSSLKKFNCSEDGIKERPVFVIREKFLFEPIEDNIDVVFIWEDPETEKIIGSRYVHVDDLKKFIKHKDHQKYRTWEPLQNSKEEGATHDWFWNIPINIKACTPYFINGDPDYDKI